jgi:hypothetical protein
VAHTRHAARSYTQDKNTREAQGDSAVRVMARGGGERGAKAARLASRSPPAVQASILRGTHTHTHTHMHTHAHACTHTHA